MGDSKSALDSYRKAVAIHEGIAPNERTEPEDSKAMARAQLRLGSLLQGMNRLPEAERTYGRVTGQLEGMPSGAAAPDVHGDLANAYQKLAAVQVQLGHADAARSAMEKAIEHGEAFARDHPGDTDAQSNLASTYYIDSEGLRARGQYGQALDRARQARALQERLLQKDPLNQRLVRALLFSLNGEGANLKFLDQQEGALRVYHHAVGIAEDMLRRDPADRWAQLAVMIAESSLGRALVEAGRGRASLPWLRKARTIAARVVAEDPAMGFARNELAIIDAAMGRALLAEKAAATRREGCQTLARSLEAWRGMAAEGPLTGDTVAAVRDTEGLFAACRSASR